MIFQKPGFICFDIKNKGTEFSLKQEKFGNKAGTPAPGERERISNREY